MTKEPRATQPLAEKLAAIRLWKGMTQAEILRRVYPKVNEDHRSYIAQWEKARREPRRDVLIRYARLAGISLEILMDDDQPLPAHLTVGSRADRSGDTDQRGDDADRSPVKAAAPHRRTGESQSSEENERLAKNEESGAACLPAMPPGFNYANLFLNTPDSAGETTDGTTAERPADESAANTKAMEDTAEAEIDFGSDRLNDDVTEFSFGATEAEAEEAKAEAEITDAARYIPLSLVIGDVPTEPVTFELPVTTLDELHDTHLGLLAQLPRALRPMLTLAGIVDLCLNAFLADYLEHPTDGLLAQEVQRLTDDSQ